MKDFEFYQDLDLRYPELAICLEDSVEGVAKFYIPVLTPLLESDNPYDITDNYVSKSNILSDSSSMEIGACTTSNYLELHLPSITDMHYIDPETDEVLTVRDSCVKGEVFAVLFIGGDPNKNYILGMYNNDINQ
ncbi:MAG: hypothetical protein IJY76_00595 [Anaerotignum sp.]|nr:hypothetical protein [Anaerotignum sp.]